MHFRFDEFDNSTIYNIRILIFIVSRNSIPSMIFSIEFLRNMGEIIFAFSKEFSPSFLEWKTSEILLWFDDRMETNANEEFQGDMLHPVLTEEKWKPTLSYRKGDLRLELEDKTRHNFTGETRKEGGKNRHSSVIKLEWYGRSDVPPRGHGISVKLRSSLPRDEILIYISILVAFG